jgi:hypothetical protein
MANPNPSPSTRWKPGQRGPGLGGRPKGLPHYIQAQTHKGRDLINWYLSIWRGSEAPLGRTPKPAERFEAAETLLAYDWGRPPQYVDLALASTEVRRIEVTFDVAPLEDHRDSPSIVVDVTPESSDGREHGEPSPGVPLGLPAPPSHDD